MATKAVSRAPNSTPPNQTLYCTNIDDHLQKEDLRRSLYMLFSTYGPILDIIALKTSKMRGQAHVVFRDVQSSTQAMRACQGFEFFGKPMKIQYAKGKSDTVAKLDGTFKMPEAAAAPAAATELQQSIFNAPPSSTKSAAPTQADAGAGAEQVRHLNGVVGQPHGTKRPRDEAEEVEEEQVKEKEKEEEEVEEEEEESEEVSDEDEDVPMEEDDEDAAMEESDED